MACDCDDGGCECKMVRTFTKIIQKLNKMDMDIERVCSLLDEMEMRINEMEEVRREKTSPSGHYYENYYGDLTGRS